MSEQILLFETTQTDNGDGSFTVRPKRVSVQREIGSRKAASILGLHIKTVHRLCEIGEENGGLKAWKLPSKRGNAKWRIDWESVTGYKERRRAQEGEHY